MELKPGYKKTEVGVIPEDWEVNLISDFADCTAGGTPLTNVRAYWGGQIRWMNSGELNLKRVAEVNGRITDVGLANSSAKLIPPNSVLIGLAGQGKTRGTVAINLVELCTNQSIATVLPNDLFVPEYLYFNLDARYDELRELSSGGGGRGGLNLRLIKSLKTPLPPVDEQRAIATVLSDMDSYIESLQNLIAKKRLIKQGAMQELLTGKRRLPGFQKKPGYKKTEVGVIPEDWEVQPLFHLSNTISDGEHSTPKRSDRGFYLLSARNIQNSHLDLSDVDYVEEEEYQRIRKRCAPEFSDVLISCSGTVGRVATVPENIECVLVRSVALVRSVPERLSGEYLEYFLQSEMGQKQIFSSLNQGAQANLFLKQIQNLNIALPPIKSEQTDIATVLSDMDSEIETLESKLSKARDLKQGMMQELLTGRIRLL